MKKSVFKKYVSVVSIIILVTIIFLGITFMIIATSFFRNEKYSLLEKNVKTAIDFAKPYVTFNIDPETNEMINIRFASSTLKQSFDIIGNANDTVMFLTNLDGVTQVCNEGEDCIHTSNQIPQKLLSKMNGGNYHETGDLFGFYNKSYFTYASPLSSSNGQIVGYIFSSYDAQSLNVFLYGVFKIFFFSALIILLIAFIVVYMVTSRITRPLREMVVATQSFAQGDFRARINARESGDEIDILANSFNNMASSLSTLEHMRRSFIANVSHELKTPMTTISGFIDGILDGTIAVENQSHYLRIVSDETNRLARVVKSMLNLSRIEAGEIKINPTPTDLNNLLCTALFSFEHKIEDNNIEIRGLDDKQVFVLIDPDTIHQVIYNLLDNALKFTPQGGYLEFSFERNNGMVYTRIKNSGAGIAREDIPLVFDRFYKSDKSRSLNKSGVGLGLYIVKTIVNMHAGEIWVESVEGDYCEFIFSLPEVVSTRTNRFSRKKQNNTNDMLQ